MYRKSNLTAFYRRYMIISAFLIGFLLLCICCYPKKAEAKDHTVKTYSSIVIEEGDTLWSIASDNAPADIDVNDYIQEVRRINQIKTNEIIGGESLIIPIYTISDFS